MCIVSWSIDKTSVVCAPVLQDGGLSLPHYPQQVLFPAGFTIIWLCPAVPFPAAPLFFGDWKVEIKDSNFPTPLLRALKLLNISKYLTVPTPSTRGLPPSSHSHGKVEYQRYPTLP